MRSSTPSYRPQIRYHALQPRQFPRHRLRKRPPLRRQQNDALRRGRIPATKLPCPILSIFFCRKGGIAPNPLRFRPDPQRLQRLGQRFRFQHHSLAASERPVIDSPVPVVREVTQVVHIHCHASLGLGSPHDAVLEEPRKESRENSDNVETHS